MKTHVQSGNKIQKATMKKAALFTVIAISSLQQLISMVTLM